MKNKKTPKRAVTPPDYIFLFGDFILYSTPPKVINPSGLFHAITSFKDNLYSISCKKVSFSIGVTNHIL